MRVMITGGTGFIGSNLVRRLVTEGHEVVAYDVAPTVSRIADVRQRVRVVEADILDLAKLTDTIAEHGIDRVVHLAAFLPEAAIRENPTKAIKYNAEGTNNVFEAARATGIERVVYASTDAVNPVGPKEDAPCKPTTLYGHLKLLNEAMGVHFATHFGLDTIGLRFGMNYGPGDRLFAGELERKYASAVVHDAIEKVALGRPAVVPFHESTSFHWTYVRDNANAIFLALRARKTKSRVFNVCGEEPYTLAYMAEILRGIVPNVEIEFSGKPMPSSLRTAEAQRMDCSAAREELGYEPDYSLAQGLGDYVATMQSGQGK